MAINYGTYSMGLFAGSSQAFDSGPTTVFTKGDFRDENFENWRTLISFNISASFIKIAGSSPQ